MMSSFLRKKTRIVFICILFLVYIRNTLIFREKNLIFFYFCFRLRYGFKTDVQKKEESQRNLKARTVVVRSIPKMTKALCQLIIWRPPVYHSFRPAGMPSTRHQLQMPDTRQQHRMRDSMQQNIMDITETAACLHSHCKLLSQRRISWKNWREVILMYRYLPQTGVLHQAVTTFLSLMCRH